MTASIIAAGLKTTNLVFEDDDDTILGGAGSAIGSIIVKGDVTADSYFAAGFTAKPKFAGAPVDPATDGRFKLG